MAYHRAVFLCAALQTPCQVILSFAATLFRFVKPFDFKDEWAFKPFSLTMIGSLV